MSVLLALVLELKLISDLVSMVREIDFANCRAKQPRRLLSNSRAMSLALPLEMEPQSHLEVLEVHLAVAELTMTCLRFPSSVMTS